MKRRAVVLAALPMCFAGLAVAQSADSSSPTQSATDPLTGSVELVNTVSAASGSGSDILYVRDNGAATDTQTEPVTSDAGGNLDPRIAIGATGNTCVAWWRHLDRDEVHFRRRLRTDGSWSSDLRVSLTTEAARRPAIVAASGGVWVAYELDAAAGRALSVVFISDGPEPFPENRSILTSTSSAASLGAMLFSESGRLWVEWTDSGSSLGWSPYDPVALTWGAPRLEPWDAGSDPDAVDARARIRNTVLAQ